MAQEGDLEWLMHYVVPDADHAKYITAGIDVRPSNIPNAGEGLFATKAFQRGDLICELPGCWVPTSALDDKAVGTEAMKGRYPFTVEGNKVLSYLTHPCQGNKINSCAWGTSNFSGTLNVELRQKSLVPPEDFHKGGAVLTEALLGVYASGDINVGQELLADYGGTFFKNVTY